MRSVRQMGYRHHDLILPVNIERRSKKDDVADIWASCALPVGVLVPPYHLLHRLVFKFAQPRGGFTP